MLSSITPSSTWPPSSRTVTSGALTVSEPKALLALQLLLEGNSIRSTERIAGINRNRMMQVLLVGGEKCEHGAVIADGVTDSRCAGSFWLPFFRWPS
jgi:hypothetical protein